MHHTNEVEARQDSSSRSLLRAWLRRATWIAGMAAGLALPACLDQAGGEADDDAANDAQANDAQAGSEHETSQALGGFPVGVIPDAGEGCPPSSALPTRDYTSVASTVSCSGRSAPSLTWPT
jgi:hypothetical protein